MPFSSRKDSDMLLELFTKWADTLASVRSDRGATAVEYAIMVAMIATVIIASVTALGLKVSDMFIPIASAL
jgi:pilus assembly protein Flp/PilA